MDLETRLAQIRGKLTQINQQVVSFNQLANESPDDIRRSLSVVPDDVVYHVASNISTVESIRQFASEELNRRLHNENHRIPLATLFEIADRLGDSTLESKEDQHFQEEIINAMARSVPFEEVESVAVALLQTLEGRLDANTYLFDEALSYRQDIDTIVMSMVEQALSQMKNPERIRKVMEAKILSARKIQRERRIK